MFDIKSLAVKDTSDLHLRSADDELLFTEDGKPITITVYGPGSKAYAKAETAQNNRMLDRLKKKGKADQTPDEKIAEQAEFLAACTKSFNNFSYGGLAGDEQFKACYSDKSVGFIGEQVGKHIADWGNFTQGSAKN
mgnify:CR=1 FL=1